MNIVTVIIIIIISVSFVAHGSLHPKSSDYSHLRSEPYSLSIAYSDCPAFIAGWTSQCRISPFLRPPLSYPSNLNSVCTAFTTASAVNCLIPSVHRPSMPDPSDACTRHCLIYPVPNFSYSASTTA
ncbi:hypothetical protein PoB_004979800 [Plakobranchus ocellatus]|uniref:Secreted protein n=1 Tax=Plakobranchus ocellatus TaxID=259542 RepID=A0AAV4BWX4_9GAST|nr:hypothetical protein PoB_004979800 [Plakobranchus ocellatus]